MPLHENPIPTPVSRLWEEWRRILPHFSMALSLPASEVVAAGEAEGLAEWATWMRGRYLL